MHDLDIQAIDTEVDARLAEIRADPEQALRYDRNGDGIVDEDEWAIVRKMVSAEVYGAHMRAAKETSADDEVAAESLQKVIAGRFEIESLLGEGGQGKTYRAQDQETGQTVAVKALHVGKLEDWKAVELFEREGAVLKSLDHPGIPSYIDAFFDEESEDGTFYLVQEYVDGDDLESRLEAGEQWDEGRAREVMRQVLEILMYLQELSPPVIHRDIKPSNLIERRDGSIALVDFGAVQTVVPKTVGGSTIVGTTGYMPMEQLMGRAVPATDLYGLGATVIHLLSRVHPADLPVVRMKLEFGREIGLTPSMAELLERMVDRCSKTGFSWRGMC